MESHATMRLTCIRKLHHFTSSALSKEKTALRAYVCQASKVLWSISIRRGNSKCRVGSREDATKCWGERQRKMLTAVSEVVWTWKICYFLLNLSSLISVSPELTEGRSEAAPAWWALARSITLSVVTMVSVNDSWCTDVIVKRCRFWVWKKPFVKFSTALHPFL